MRSSHAGAFGVAVTIIACTAVAGAAVLCIRRPGRRRVIGLTLVAFPFVYAVNPLTWWLDGRYSIYLPPLLALVVAIGSEEVVHISSRRRGPMRQATTPITRLTRSRAIIAGRHWHRSRSRQPAISFWSLMPFPPPPLIPTRATLQTIARLERSGMTYGYAAYWMAYRLDFLSGSHLIFSPIPNDHMRSPGILDSVEHQHHGVAWLFVPHDHLAASAQQFGTTDLQTGFDPESNFLFALHRAGSSTPSSGRRSLMRSFRQRRSHRTRWVSGCPLRDSTKLGGVETSRSEKRRRGDRPTPS